MEKAKFNIEKAKFLTWKKQKKIEQKEKENVTWKKQRLVWKKQNKITWRRDIPFLHGRSKKNNIRKKLRIANLTKKSKSS